MMRDYRFDMCGRVEAESALCVDTLSQLLPRPLYYCLGSSNGLGHSISLAAFRGLEARS